MTSAERNAEAITITVKVTGEEYPELFAHLMEIQQGKRRANRLRMLADRGLRVSASSVEGRLREGAALEEPKGSPVASAAAQQMFDPNWG